MFGIYTNGGVSFNGTISPFGEKYLSSAVPSDLPQTYSITTGRPPEKVQIDISDIHITIVPPAPVKKRAEARPSRRRPAASLA